MQEWILAFVNTFGCFGIFLLIFIENIFPPIPSEAVLLFSGALTVTTAMTVPETILAATAGSLAGAAVLYALGWLFQAQRLKRLLAGRFGRITRLRPSHVEKAERWFSRYQGRAVLMCRCVPLVRSLISVPAGFAKMKILPFMGLTALGSAVWNTALVCIGAGLGSAWESAIPYLDRYTRAAVVLLGAAVLLAGGLLLLRRHRRGRAAAQAGEASPPCSENGSRQEL